MSTYKAGRPSKYNPTTKKGVEPPKCAGEYRIRNAEGALTYIGERKDGCSSTATTERCLTGKTREVPLNGKRRMADRPR